MIFHFTSPCLPDCHSISPTPLRSVETQHWAPTKKSGWRWRLIHIILLSTHPAWQSGVPTYLMFGLSLSKITNQIQHFEAINHQEMLFFGLTTFYKTGRNCLSEVGATEWNYIWKSSFLRSPFYQYNLYNVYICTSPCLPIAAQSILLFNLLKLKFGLLQRRADGAGGWSTFYFPVILLGNRVFLYIWCLDCPFQK